MDSGSINLLLDAKTEYTKQLINILKQPVLQLIKRVYSEAEALCNQENIPENILLVFQDNLSRIPKWDSAKLKREYEAITKNSECDWLDDLLKVIYITHIKILTLVSQAKTGAKLQIKAPTGYLFIHLVLKEAAREAWKVPYLYCTNVPKTEYLKNMRELESIISGCIEETIRQQLPIKKLVTDYLETTLIKPPEPIPIIKDSRPKKVQIVAPPQPVSVPLTQTTSQVSNSVPNKEEHLENRGITPKQHSLKNTRNLREMLMNGNNKSSSSSTPNNSINNIKAKAKENTLNILSDIDDDLQEIPLTSSKMPLPVETQQLPVENTMADTQPVPVETQQLPVENTVADIQPPSETQQLPIETQQLPVENTVIADTQPVTQTETQSSPAENTMADNQTAVAENQSPSADNSVIADNQPQPADPPVIITTENQPSSSMKETNSLGDVLDDIDLLESVNMKPVSSKATVTKDLKVNRGGFKVDSLDNLDLEMEDPIDLSALQQQKKEVRPAKTFRFFND